MKQSEKLEGRGIKKTKIIDTSVEQKKIAFFHREIREDYSYFWERLLQNKWNFKNLYQEDIIIYIY